MRYLILFILILPLTTYDQEISDLYFFPKKGEFFGQTSLNFSMTELSVGSSSASLKLENDEKKLSQTIAFGINDRFAMFLTLPYALGGESKLNIFRVDLIRRFRKRISWDSLNFILSVF